MITTTRRIRRRGVSRIESAETIKSIGYRLRRATRMEWREGRLKVEGRGEEREEEERVRIKGNGHYLHRSRLTILLRPSRSRPSPAAIPDLGRVAVRSFVRVGQGKNAWEFIRPWWRSSDIGQRMREYRRFLPIFTWKNDYPLKSVDLLMPPLSVTVIERALFLFASLLSSVISYNPAAN